MELLMPHHYEQHLLRMPAAEWPDPVNRAFKHLNRAIYVPMQGPSELGASGALAWIPTPLLGTNKSAYWPRTSWSVFPPSQGTGMALWSRPAASNNGLCARF